MSIVEEAKKTIEMFHGYVAVKGSRPDHIERAPQNPEPSYTMYVGNLPWDTVGKCLEQIFREHNTGRWSIHGLFTIGKVGSRGFENLDRQFQGGRVIRVNVAEDRLRCGGF